MKTSIVPVPVRITERDGAAALSPRAVIHATGDCRGEAEYLASRLAQAAGGVRPRIAKPSDPAPAKGAIALRASEGFEIGRGTGGEAGSAEGYRLSVSPKGVHIDAAGAPGIFNGIQTLLQLLPTGAREPIPCVEIEDFPRFPWRGLMLDCSRHFFPVEFITRFIDLLAMHRMNVFHWHLTDDQGWRLQINRSPRLTEIGAWRRETLVGKLDAEPARFDGVRHGGFYTQAEVRAVVAHAASRHVTVVPEIEMPGHSLATVAAYPELSCTGGPFEVGRTWGINKDVLCAGNDAVFDFLEGVLSEVASLFPGRFVHIGGDECPKERWHACPRCQQRMRDEKLADEHELQSWFIRRIEPVLNGMGKRLIGWDEILEGGLAPNAAVMSWRGIEGGLAAARAGHDAVMSPHTHCYLDHYQAEDTQKEPLAIGGCTPLERTYSYEPVPGELTGPEAAHIMGVQGNLWTEYVPTQAQAEYMAFPRACAIAEVAWSPASARSWDGFRRRLAAHLPRLDKLGVRYRPPEA